MIEDAASDELRRQIGLAGKPARSTERGGPSGSASLLDRAGRFRPVRSLIEARRSTDGLDEDSPLDTVWVAPKGLHLVIHCLPGPLPRKAAAVANVAAVLAPDGVLFGASVLGTSGRHTWAARRMLAAFNRQGGFDNLTDSGEGLGEILGASFEHVELATVRSIAIFVAMNQRTDSSG